jgi:uncharacterized radical SAM protein YgiQ
LENELKYLPTTPEEVKKLGWQKLDVILVTGDTYVDSSYIGVSVIGRVLLQAGYKVGILAQPDIHSERDITRLGEPALFWGVTAGCVDSMIANYTAGKKKRKNDDLTPGGQNFRRPDRAVIVYSNLIRRYFKNTCPIVLGGIEASLRRTSHYDFWSNSIKRSILFDAKADVLVYGMGEKTVLELAEKLQKNEDFFAVLGICYIAKEIDAENRFNQQAVFLPSHEEVVQDKRRFIEMFRMFYENTDPVTAKQLYQKQDTRYLVQNPPQHPPTTSELDRYFDLPFTRNVHPYYLKDGVIRALDTIRFSITTHRGCYGECRFCAITAHQGRRIIERSEESIVREAEHLTQEHDFKGYILDVGGPTANMYGIDCAKKAEQGACQKKHCLLPKPCRHLQVNHLRQIALLKKLRALPGIKKVFVGSGVRYDLVLQDQKRGLQYLEEVVEHHVSGQMKIAPEHCDERILRLMNKPGTGDLLQFKELFDRICQKKGKKQFLTYYFIAAHPGCTIDDMQKLRQFVKKELRLFPEQVQIFTPSPSTYSTLMYYTEVDPFTGEKLFVEKDPGKREKQKNLLVGRRE